MTYAGNAALSSAVKDRVTSTFQQTVSLHHQGRHDEVIAGCTLILQMDPMFDPARKLLEKTRNPNLPIDVDALLPRDPRAPMQQALDAMADRDFERVIHITTEILTNDILNDEARILGDEAREKLEAAPFVEQFSRKCDQSMAAGNYAAAKMDLEKARALDPTHPEVVRIARALAAHDSAPSPAPTPISPSFIVDEPSAPPTSTRSTAQAADFGFAFEEEKPQDVSFANFSFDSPSASADAGFGGFSFDSPTPAAPAAPTQTGPAEFDFATASVATSADDQKKIEQYLTDGDRAFEAGDYQQAIDLWSRIFLIDVTNDDASARIERAKAKRRELEQRIEPLLASGIAAFDRGDTARAHADLTEVLRIDPQNASAQDYLDRLEETLTGGGAASAHIPPSMPADENERLDLGFFDDDQMADLSEAPLIPPSPTAAPSAAGAKTTGKQSAAAATTKSAAPARKLPMGLIAAILAVVILGGGGWFVWNRFMNKPETTDSAQGQAIIDRASMLAKTGKYDQAIALLQDIKPNDPQHDEALVMIADLRAKKATSAEMIEGIPSAQYYSQKIEAGKLMFAAHDYAGAKKAFEDAQRVKPLPPDVKAQFDTASQQMAKLDSAKALFNERKFSEAIANLQPLAEADPQNVAIRRMITDAHFNLGASALQEERIPDAIRAFDEVLKATPNDEAAKRSRDLAVRYDGQPKDLLYRIYVKYLPLRKAA
jgi:tetratricopeptide (TPR) repeat protein